MGRITNDNRESTPVDRRFQSSELYSESLHKVNDDNDVDYDDDRVQNVERLERGSKKMAIKISVTRQQHCVTNENNRSLKERICKPLVNAITNPCMPKDEVVELSSVKGKVDPRKDRVSQSNHEIPRTREESISPSSTSTCTSSEPSVNDDSSSEDRSMAPSPSHRTNDNNDPGSPEIVPPPPRCDLVVSIGTEDFLYNADILLVASDYLNSASASRDVHGCYHVSFPYHSAQDDWRPFAGFMQSYLVGASELTWNVFPCVFPWFVHFEMQQLLRESEVFLLRTARAYQIHDMENRTMLSVTNLLMILKIAYTHGFESTKARARLWIQMKLLEPMERWGTGNSIIEKHLAKNKVCDALQWSLNDLQVLSELLSEFDTLRDFLWESAIILYLPHDLNVADSHGLCTNRLFPYLLREGMMQLLGEPTKDAAGLATISDEHSRTKQQSARSTSPATTFASDATLLTHHLGYHERRLCLPNETLTNHLQKTIEKIERFQKIKRKMEKKQQQKGQNRKNVNKGTCQTKMVTRRSTNNSSDIDKKDRGRKNKASAHRVRATIKGDNHDASRPSWQPSLPNQRFAC